MTQLPPFVPWELFYPRWVWNQGEHLTIVGPTGTGKSTLMRAALNKRYDAGGAVAVLGTKTEDRTLTDWHKGDNLTRIPDWPPRWPGRWWDAPRDDAWTRRVMLWPTIDTPDDVTNLGPTFRHALASMFTERGWCVAADELWYLCAEMGLSDVLKAWWSQGRSAGLTLVGATQRPVDIPLLAYSSATHLFLFADPDERNLERLSALGGLPPEQVRAILRVLPFHDVLYVNTRDRVLIRTRVPVKKG